MADQSRHLSQPVDGIAKSTEMRRQNLHFLSQHIILWGRSHFFVRWQYFAISSDAGKQRRAQRAKPAHRSKEGEWLAQFREPVDAMGG